MLIYKIIISGVIVVLFLLHYYYENKIFLVFSGLLIVVNPFIDSIEKYIKDSKSSFSFPSLTTFSAYNERLILTNHSSRPVSYRIIISVTDSSTFELKNEGGEIGPNTDLVLRTEDIVTITGGSSFSALVNISAPASDVDVILKSVNLATKEVERIAPNKK